MLTVISWHYCVQSMWTYDLNNDTCERGTWYGSVVGRVPVKSGSTRPDINFQCWMYCQFIFINVLCPCGRTIKIDQKKRQSSFWTFTADWELVMPLSIWAQGPYSTVKFTLKSKIWQNLKETYLHMVLCNSPSLSTELQIGLIVLNKFCGMQLGTLI